MNLGYIRLHRQIIESVIWNKPPLYLKVWLYLLMRAQHTEFNKLKPGQLRTTIKDIQNACRWMEGACTKTPSYKQIYGAIEFLRNPFAGQSQGTDNEPMIGTTQGTHGMLITVLKYSEFQTKREDAGNDAGNDKKDSRGSRRAKGGKDINRECFNDDLEESSLVADSAVSNSGLLLIQSKLIVGHLNAKLKLTKHFKNSVYDPKSKYILKDLKALFEQHFVTEDILSVIDTQFSLTKGLRKDEFYFRPKTLFRPSNFVEYIQVARNAKPGAKVLTLPGINQYENPQAYSDFINGVS